MGPLRGRLILQILILSLGPATAVAEVCDKERPLWKPTYGPATAVEELITLATLPPSLIAFAISAFALIMRLRLLCALSGLIWGGLFCISAMDYFGPILDDVRYFAIKEGCIGLPHLFIALAIAICALMIKGASRPRT